ncbi:flagellar hook protein FlgE [Candidatus Manganitrophus noduliformans]|uniref:Flagellar hook protein FlgE n=1 Tax=Candidatus Manganitrophus noduliformans TaxID=2606439 RepID=A0A7X6DTD6_9BACT|nr:flagellar hook protein FlgE [Candidatus Manganitrophus noduliformans]NKE73047.1 flagellar hook protein FlgE [Candidatus Manganitrophus noduliformans]
MAILTSLFSSVSGINAFGNGLSVISNNIANMATIGFKDSSVAFADIIGEGSSSNQIGHGVFVSGIRTQFIQGSFETTGNGLDMALEGDGFFLLRTPEGTESYTRAGLFSVDQNGLIANPEGLLLQGYQADPTGELTGQIGNLNVASTSFPPQSTAEMSIVANIDSRATIPPAFDVTDPTATSNFSTSLSMFDSLGNSHLVSIFFRKSATGAGGNTWEWFALVEGADSASGVTEIQAQGTLTFTTAGELDTVSAITYPTGGFDFSGGATQNQIIDFNFGESITTDGGTGLNGLTQFGSNSGVLNQLQDGYASGSLQRVSVNKEGLITGLFTNGKSRTLGGVTLGRFNNPQGLVKLGNNLYAVSSDSGQPIFGSPDSAGMGRILASSLELSSVDLAGQFVKMIEYQRGFQANSRVISITDEILQELVNLTR